MADFTNAQIAAAFEELADLYELDGAVQYRVVAYRNAARTVRDSSVSVMQLARDGKVTELPNIGKTLEEKLIALDETGDIPTAVKLRAKIPVGLISVMHLPGFGPKRAKRLYDEIGVDSLDALRAAVEDGRLRELRGFGLKAEENLKQVLAEHAEDGPARRVVLSRAVEAADQVVEALRAHPAADRVEVAGSLRRWTDSVKDVDIIATASDPAALARALGELEIVESVSQSGDVGARVTTHTGLKIDLKVVEPDQFGNVLQHFTGSKAHNVSLRESAVRRGLHVSEYGIADDATGETLRCSSEEEVYAALGLEWIPPELREGRGELEAAAGGGLPDLIELGDLRGELHCHTTMSDGTEVAETMAQAAIELGLEYLAITDHSATHGFGDHVTEDQLRARIEEIRGINERLDGIRAADRDREQHPARRLARLPRRPAGRARLGDRLDPHVVRDGREEDDRPPGGGDRAPAGRRHRPPDRPQDREAAAVRAGDGPRDRGGGPHRHDDRDQRLARPPRPQRCPRPRGRRGRRAHPRRLRRPLAARHPRVPALRHRHRAAGLADRRSGREHASVEGVREAAEAGYVTGWRRNAPPKPGVRTSRIGCSGDVRST